MDGGRVIQTMPCALAAASISPATHYCPSDSLPSRRPETADCGSQVSTQGCHRRSLAAGSRHRSSHTSMEPDGE